MLLLIACPSPVDSLNGELSVPTAVPITLRPSPKAEAIYQPLKRGTEVTMSPFMEVDHEKLGNRVRKMSWNYTDLGSIEKTRDFSFLTGLGLTTSEND